MFKKFIFSGWGLFLSLFIYQYVLSTYFEYVINREVAKELQDGILYLEKLKQTLKGK